MHARNCRIVFPTDQINRSCKSRISSRVKSRPARCKCEAAPAYATMQGGQREGAATQRPAPASLPAPAAGAAGPRVGRPALALPALEAGSGVAQKLAAVELKPSSRCPVGGGAGCQPAACGAENCCCLFSFFSFLRGNCCLTRARMQAASQIFFFLTQAASQILLWAGSANFQYMQREKAGPSAFLPNHPWAMPALMHEEGTSKENLQNHK